jgi:cob(I)alamin adenosyltransferase
VIQFIKGEWPNGERNLLEPHGVEFQVMATGFTGTPRTAKPTPPPVWPSGSTPKNAGRPSLNMVLLDEITYMVAYDYLPLEAVLDALKTVLPIRR